MLPLLSVMKIHGADLKRARSGSDAGLRPRYRRTPEKREIKPDQERIAQAKVGLFYDYN